MCNCIQVRVEELEKVYRRVSDLQIQIKAAPGPEAVKALNIQLNEEVMIALALANAIPERAAHHYNATDDDVMLVSDLEGFTFEQLIQFQRHLLRTWKDINVLIRRRSELQNETDSPQMAILAAAVRELAADAMHAGWRLVREIESLKIVQ